MGAGRTILPMRSPSIVRRVTRPTCTRLSEPSDLYDVTEAQDFDDEPLPDVEFYDAERWSLEAGSEHAPLVPIVDHGPMDIWMRGSYQFMRVLAEVPYPRFSFTLRELQVKKFAPHWLLNQCLPRDLDFQWYITSRNLIL